MFCTDCGTKNLETADFCKKCGKQLVKEELNYAGFWIRFGAFFIDIIGFLISCFIIGIILALLGLSSLVPSGEGVDTLVGLVLLILYNSVFLSLWSTSPGKFFYGLTVYDENNNKLNFSSSFIRSLLQPLSMLFFGVGYWNMDKNEKKQAWHDKSAHTYIIAKKRSNYIIPIILTIIGFIVYSYLSSQK